MAQQRKQRASSRAEKRVAIMPQHQADASQRRCCCMAAIVVLLLRHSGGAIAAPRQSCDGPVLPRRHRGRAYLCWAANISVDACRRPLTTHSAALQHADRPRCPLRHPVALRPLPSAHARCHLRCQGARAVKIATGTSSDSRQRAIKAERQYAGVGGRSSGAFRSICWY